MTALAEFSFTFHSRRAATYLKRLNLRPRDEGLFLAAQEHLALAREELKLISQNAPMEKILEKLEKQLLKWEEKFRSSQNQENSPENPQNSNTAIRDTELALAAAKNNLDAAELGLNEGIIRGEQTSIAFQGKHQALELAQESLENQRTDAALARQQLRRLWGRVLAHRWQMALALVISLGLLGLTIWDFVKSIQAKE